LNSSIFRRHEVKPIDIGRTGLTLVGTVATDRGFGLGDTLRNVPNNPVDKGIIDNKEQ
jgi:hypothetical protein